MIYQIQKQKTALLIIDAQKEYSGSDRPLYTADFAETANNINRLSEQFRNNGMPVFLVRHVHDADGRDVGRMGDFSTDEVFTKGSTFTDIDPLIITAENDILIEKTRYSSFVNTNLESYLKTLQVDTIIITGFMVGYCCVTTARHAHDLDYRVIYANDANSGPAFGDLGFGDISIEEIKKVVATLLAGGVAEVITTDEIINRIN